MTTKSLLGTVSLVLLLGAAGAFLFVRRRRGVVPAPLTAGGLGEQEGNPPPGPPLVESAAAGTRMR